MVERIEITDPKLAARVESVLADLRNLYPDGVIRGLDNRDRALSKRLLKVWKAVGYADREGFLNAYGLESVREKAGGGQVKWTRESAEEMLSELARRYEGREKPEGIEELKEQNPDLSSGLRTVTNKSKELFGEGLPKVLRKRGILAGPLETPGDVSDEQIETMLQALSSIYRDSPSKPTSLDELARAHPEYEVTLKAFSRRSKKVYGTTPVKKMIRLGIFGRSTKGYWTSGASDFEPEKIEQAIDELGELLCDVPSSQKPPTLTKLIEAYPSFEELLRMADKAKLIDKRKLQLLGILAANKTLIKNQGIRKVPVSVMLPLVEKAVPQRIIAPGDELAAALPPYTIGIDLRNGVRLRKALVTVTGEAAATMKVGDRFSLSLNSYVSAFGQAYKSFVIGCGSPLELSKLLGVGISNDGVSESASSLGTYVGATVISRSCYNGAELAQLELCYLAEIDRDTLIYVLRELGIVRESDLRGEMGWRFRIRMVEREGGLPADSGETVGDNRATQEASVAQVPSYGETSAGESAPAVSQSAHPTMVEGGFGEIKVGVKPDARSDAAELTYEVSVANGDAASPAPDDGEPVAVFELACDASPVSFTIAQGKAPTSSVAFGEKPQPTDGPSSSEPSASGKATVQRGDGVEDSGKDVADASMGPCSDEAADEDAAEVPIPENLERCLKVCASNIVPAAFFHAVLEELTNTLRTQKSYGEDMAEMVYALEHIGCPEEEKVLAAARFVSEFRRGSLRFGKAAMHAYEMQVARNVDESELESMYLDVGEFLLFFQEGLTEYAEPVNAAVVRAGALVEPPGLDELMARWEDLEPSVAPQTLERAAVAARVADAINAAVYTPALQLIDVVQKVGRNNDEIARLEKAYREACEYVEQDTVSSIELAITRFGKLGSYKDVRDRLAACNTRLAELKFEAERPLLEQRVREQEEKVAAIQKIYDSYVGRDRTIKALRAEAEALDTEISALGFFKGKEKREKQEKKARIIERIESLQSQNADMEAKRQWLSLAKRSLEMAKGRLAAASASMG